MNIVSGTKFGAYQVGALLGEGSFGAVYEAIHLPTNTPVAMKFVVNKSVAQDQLCNEFCAYERIKRMVFPDSAGTTIAAATTSGSQNQRTHGNSSTINGTQQSTWSDITDADIQRVFTSARFFSSSANAQQTGVNNSSRLGGFPTSHWCKNVGGYYILTMERLGSDLDYVMMSMSRKRFSLNTVLLLAEQLLFCLFKLHAAGIVSCDVKPENIVIGHGRGQPTKYFHVGFRNCTSVLG